MAIKLGDAFVLLGAKRDKLKGDLGQAKGQVTAWTVAAGTAVGNLMGNVLAKGAELATNAVMTLGRSLVDMTLEAAGVEGVRNTFTKLVESVGGDAVQAMEDLRTATRGMVADADLMQAGNKFLAMGLAGSAEEAADLAEVATQLGMAMGEDATSSMENFALMLANQSLPRLDSFGISSGKARERILELMAANKGMTREQAFMQAVMEQARVTMEKVGEQGDTSAASMARLQAQFDNVKLGIGTGLIPVLIALMEPLVGLLQDVGPQLVAWAELAGQWLGEKLPLAIEWLQTKFQEIWPVLEGVAAWLGERLPAAGGALSGIWTEVLLPAIDVVRGFFEEKILPVLQTLWSWIQEALPVAIQVLADFWNTYLLPVLVSLQTAWQEKLRPALAELWSWLQERVPQAIAALAGFWENTLQPVVAFFGTLLSEHIIPILSDVAVWLMENIPAAIDAAATWWQETLVPAMQDVWAFIQDNVIPIIEDVIGWLQEKIPEAIEVARSFWEETLKPALESVWAFIQDDLKPLFEALVDFFDAILTKSIEALAGLWENILEPALKTVWEFIDTHIMPIFEDIVEYIEGFLVPAFETVADFLNDTLTKAFEGIKTAISEVTEFFGNLADKIGNIELPPWLKPGSPTPLEMGVRGISSAVKELAELELPTLQMAFQGMGMGGGTMDQSQHYHFEQTVNTRATQHNVMDDWGMARSMVGA